MLTGSDVGVLEYVPWETRGFDLFGLFVLWACDEAMTAGQMCTWDRQFTYFVCNVIFGLIIRI